MAQTSGIGQDESWGWPCPYCRAHNPIDAASCANCGSQLRDPDEDDLFTTVAADNAQVIPPDAPFARDNMWTTDSPDDVAEATIDRNGNGNGSSNGHGQPHDGSVDGEVVDDDLWDPVPADPWPAGDPTAFSAEPSARASDVLDEPFHVDEPARSNGRPQTTGNLFSNGSGHRRGPDPREPEVEAGAGRSPFGAPDGEHQQEPGSRHADPHHTDPRHVDPRHVDPRHQDPWAPHTPSWPGAPAGPAGYGAPFGAGPGQYAPPMGYEQPPAGWTYAPPVPPVHSAPVPDPHGLSAAVARLRPEDQERAAVPISVCGALMGHDEVVLAAVTGQMLGHPAVVVLTTRRVLVVNGRRWQPIVDVFDVGPALSVRGRHDHDVAALTFSDDTRLATVDGIAEVGLAVELAERIRGE